MYSHHSLFLALNPRLSLKASLSGLWKRAAVGVPIGRAPKVRVDFTEGGTGDSQHNIRSFMGLSLLPISLAVFHASLKDD